MKPCVCLTLILIGLALVCLLLSLTQPGLNHSLQVAASGSWLDRGTEPASEASTVLVVRSTELDPARAGPPEVLVLDCAWTARNISPPGKQTHGVPGADRALASCRSSRQLKPTPSSHLFPENCGLSTAELKNRGFATASS
jgi:hypothetical protein